MKRRLWIIIILISGLSMVKITGVLGQNPQRQPKQQKPDTTKTMKKNKPGADTLKVKPTTRKKIGHDSLHQRKDRPNDTVYSKKK